MVVAMIPFRVFLLRLALAYLGSFLVAGTLGSFSTLTDLMTQAGVFWDPSCTGSALGKCVNQNQKMQLLYYVAMAFQNIFAIPSGMLYDHQGPKFTGVFGCALASVSLLGVVLALNFSVLEWALWAVVPMALLGQNIASWGIFGFIFYYPGHVGVITGICNSSFLLSSILMYAVVALTAAMALKFSMIFLLGCAVVATVVTWVSVPTLKEYQLSFFNAFGQQPQPRRGFLEILRQLFRVFALRPKQTLAYFAASAAPNISFAYWIGATFQFNVYNLGEADSDVLARDSAILYAVIGVLASPLTGLLFDKIGLRRYSLVFLAVQSAATAMIWPSVFGVQMTVSIVMFSIYSLWLTFESKSPSIFAPPDLYGSFLGFSNSLTGILQLILNLVLPIVMSKSSMEGKWIYLVPILALMVAGVVCLLIFLLSLIVSPPPETPPELDKKTATSMAEETTHLVINE